MLSKRILLGWLIFSLTFGYLPTAAASTKQGLEASRTLFVQAEAALAQGRQTQYQTLKKLLIKYPLYPYLLYSEYDKRLTTVSNLEFQEFMDNYPDTHLAEQFRSRWLHLKAKQDDWQGFLKAYQPTEDVALQCHYLWANLQLHDDPNIVLKQITPLWLNGKVPPKSCEAVFATFEKSSLMTRSLVWQRIKLFINEGNDPLARKMSRYLKKSEVALVELWLMIHNNPYLVTQKKYFSSNHPAYLEMIVDGVSLIAKTKPESAIEIWQQIGRQYPFTERHWGLVVRAIGLAYAFQKHPEAEKWLGKVPNIYANQQVHEWRVRVALAKEDWPMVLRWTKGLPDPLSKTDEWQYWHARALDMVNHRQESQTILSRLAKSRGYYGFLASHHLLKPYLMGNNKTLVERSLIQAMSERTSVLRARELYQLGRLNKAKTEWQFVTNQMTDKEKHAAAYLALNWGLPNWSILALSKSTNKDDLKLRFPVVYGQRILQEATRHKLDPAWILAITRQESAFVPHAKNPSGAMGLMQLLPGTANMVARKHQIAYPGSHGLLEPHTNIQLGSGYLKMMLDQHKNNAVLATAAYNAGPGRIRNWLPNYDMAADLWIETIPFKETREYVKNVLTYTAIYQEMLGKTPSLSRHMPYIPSNKE